MKGLSGCQLRVSGGVVHKSAPDDKVRRLYAQAEKQRWFSEQDLSVGVPKVLQLYEGGFSMELVPGKPLLEVVEELSEQDLLVIVHSLQSFLSFCKSKTEYSPVGLMASTSAKVGKGYDLEVFSKSPCHGDLTLENMVYDKENGRLYLLDFLDSYHDHYLLDIAAVLQNTTLKFHQAPGTQSLGDYHKTNLYKLHLLFSRMIDYSFPEAAPISEYLLLAKMMRIRPYVDDERKEWLEETIKRLEEFIYGSSTTPLR